MKQLQSTSERTLLAAQIPQPLKEKLVHLSKDKGQSLTLILVEILEDYFEKKAKK